MASNAHWSVNMKSDNSETTDREPRCQHGKHILLDPPCQECVKEVATFRKRCYNLESARAKLT
jgi:hypothetical protein